MLESALDGEITDHVGYDKSHDPIYLVMAVTAEHPSLGHFNHQRVLKEIEGILDFDL